MKYITLKGMKYNNVKIKVDDDIYDELSHCRFRWNTEQKVVTFYTPDPSTDNSLKKYIMKHDSYRETIIFKNGDKFDYQRSNLTIKDRYYEKIKRDTTKIYGTTYKGITTNCKNPGKYLVFITIPTNKRVYIGARKTMESAAKLYDSAATYIRGKDNTYLNFPDNIEELSEDMKYQLKEKIRKHNSDYNIFGETHVI